MYNKILYTCILGMVCFHSLAQTKWKGDTGDGLWRTPLNWTDGIAPIESPTMDIVLDNSHYPESYTVRITANDSIIIHSLIIAPDPGKTITLIIDTSAYRSIALTVVSVNRGITIYDGGKLLNGSKAANGDVIKITDSLQLNNGAFYSHQTRRTHNELVNRLAKRPGTEKGIFEFNIPSASNTISLSNRTYGSLHLASAIYGKPCTYSGAGTNPLKIRGDLLIDTSVTFSINLSDTVSVGGSFIQKGGVFNTANSTRSPIIAIKGNWEQEGGEIIRTGSGIPALLFNGINQQSLRFQSTPFSNILVSINNSAGVLLQKPLTIHYRLELRRGAIRTTASNLLTLLPNSELIVDSTSNLSFVDGPLKVEGLLAKGHFLFPVGKDGLQRWLGLKNATGSFNVEYFRNDPHGLSDLMDEKLHHVSRMEYWAIQADPAATAKVALSFNHTSGSITDLITLRVGKWKASGTWQDAGNTGTTGTAESGGSITSNPLTGFSGTHYFALASSSLGYNVLPVNRSDSLSFYQRDTRSKYGIRSVFATSGTLHCVVYSDMVRSLLMEVINMNGRPVFFSTQYLLKGKNAVQLSNFNVPAGVYILQVTDRTSSGKPTFYGTHRFLVVR